MIKFRSQSEAARQLGINRGTFHAWCHKSGFPRGSAGPWTLPSIVEWLIERDPLLDGRPEDSAALERYRQAKAELAEWELAEKRRTMISCEESREIHAAWSAILRRAAGQLGRQFGPKAQEFFESALDECRELIDRQLAASEQK